MLEETFELDESEVFGDEGTEVALTLTELAVALPSPPTSRGEAAAPAWEEEDRVSESDDGILLDSENDEAGPSTELRKEALIPGEWNSEEELEGSEAGSAGGSSPIARPRASLPRPRGSRSGSVSPSELSAGLSGQLSAGLSGQLSGPPSEATASHPGSLGARTASQPRSVGIGFRGLPTPAYPAVVGSLPVRASLGAPRGGAHAFGDPGLERAGSGGADVPGERAHSRRPPVYGASLQDPAPVQLGSSMPIGIRPHLSRFSTGSSGLTRTLTDAGARAAGGPGATGGAGPGARAAGGLSGLAGSGAFLHPPPRVPSGSSVPGPAFVPPHLLSDEGQDGILGTSHASLSSSRRDWRTRRNAIMRSTGFLEPEEGADATAGASFGFAPVPSAQVGIPGATAGSSLEPVDEGGLASSLGGGSVGPGSAGPGSLRGGLHSLRAASSLTAMLGSSQGA